MGFKTQPPDELDVKILEYIRNNPGCGIGDVIRETKESGLQNASIRYRVNKLSKTGYIKLNKVLDRYYLLYHTEKAVILLMKKGGKAKRNLNEEGNSSPNVTTRVLSPSSCTPNQDDKEASR